MNSDNINEIAVALAQAELPNPKKTHTANAGTYRYSYAPLSEVVDAVRKPLADKGLSYTQVVQQTESTGITLVTMLMHKSGQWISSQYPLPKGLNSQDMGKAITYARRYSLCAILGIAAEDDDDGAGAVEGERAAKEAEEDQRRAEARKRLEEAKAKGLIKDAHTGAILKPGEEPKPADQEQPKEHEPKPTEAADPLAGIPMKLALLMNRDKISVEQVRAFIVARKHFTPGFDLTKLPDDYVTAITRPDNWEKVLVTTKKEGK
jgi:hypothetical protein